MISDDFIFNDSSYVHFGFIPVSVFAAFVFQFSFN